MRSDTGSRVRPATALRPGALLPALADLLLPATCAGCGGSGASWCAVCHGGFGWLRRVRRPVLATGPPVFALADYAGPVRRGLLAYKEQGGRGLAAPFGSALAAVVPWLPGVRPELGGWCLVPVPSRRSAARRRGGDHLVRLARQCARSLAVTGQGAVVARALRVESGVADSAGLGAAARLANLAGRLHPRLGTLPPPGRSVLLLDDVITTGATAACATGALAAAGVSVAAVLALSEVP